jgi:transketolase
MRDTFVQALTTIAAARRDVTLITGDLGFGVLEEFAQRFPSQFLNIGVAEQNMTGVAAGLALEGRTVFTYSIGNFPTLRCLEQIRNDVCYHDANVKIVSVGGGMSYGAVGMSHHATEDLAILRALPGMVVIAPGDHWEVAEATRALVEYRGPAYLRLDKSGAPPSQRADERYRVGRARVLAEGREACIIASGGILGEAVEAAGRLAHHGVSCGVVSMHTIKPLDVETLQKVASTTCCIVTLEEHNVDGGLGGAVAEALLEAGAAPRRFVRLGLRDRFSSAVGSQSYLRRQYGLDAASVVNAVLTSIHNRIGERELNVA